MHFNLSVRFWVFTEAQCRFNSGSQGVAVSVGVSRQLRILGQRVSRKSPLREAVALCSPKTCNGLQLAAAAFCSHPGPKPDSFQHHINHFGNSCSGPPEPLWLIPLLHLEGGPFTQGGAIMP